MKLKGKKLNIFRGIGAKTTLSHVIVAVAIIFFASISLYVILFTYARNYIESNLLDMAIKISELESGQDSLAYNEEREWYYEQLCEAEVMFFDYDYLNSDFTGVDKYFFASILSGAPISDIRSFQFVDSEIIFAGAPIRNSGGDIIGGIILMQPMDEFNEQTAVMLRMLLMITAISIPIAVAVSRRYARRLTKPLIEISNGAQLLAEGRFGERIAQESNDEIGEIANSLNILSGRLRHSIGNLRRERDMLNLMMNGINEGMIAVDWYMHTVHCNASFLRMLEMERRPGEVSRESEYGRILHACMKSNALEKSIWTDRSGHRLWAVASPLHGDGSIIIGAVCLVQDISEAERLEQMRRDYVANISHELRTPLTGIRGMVEPLIDGVFETEAEKQNCYNVIHKETIRLEKLIREMLDMSRLQDGRISIELEPIELASVIFDGAGRVAAAAQEAGIDLRVELHDEDAPIICIGNEDRALQALTIFLDNALSFTPAGGSVTIYTRAVEGRIRLGVLDTGCGIEPKDMPYIWERFYKVDKSRMRTSGTGLGLAIAKLVAELMHGEIGVNSEPGIGADFWFTLPVADTAE